MLTASRHVYDDYVPSAYISSLLRSLYLSFIHHLFMHNHNVPIYTLDTINTNTQLLVAFVGKLTNFTLPSILRHKRDNQITDFYANSRFYKNRESKRKLVSSVGYHNNAIRFVYFAVFLLYLHFIWILRISASSNSLCTREDARGEGNKLVTR